MDRGAWEAIAHGVAKELDMTEQWKHVTQLRPMGCQGQFARGGCGGEKVSGRDVSLCSEDTRREISSLPGFGSSCANHRMPGDVITCDS